ncbi:two-component sensor histidine kinase [Saccharibacillus sp. O23]|uniref:sensor histidine kinase n=1 Tax=Saccharibacillus sp. O23 TaxID=2009338 RepID=UPI000B4220FF|nr:ATP-binding protein [Saccharibacillus sp. O23]OWA33022.1 two-component sensor histidine kinase [Saccharibacillus sp. O16]OWR25695.1 two-component sensor histidine kinase [Saccharibacillus sp. O23]
MKKTLYTKLVFLFVFMGILLLTLTMLTLLISIHYHMSLYVQQAGTIPSNIIKLNHHLEEALLQTTLWTFIISVFLAIFLGLRIAKQISRPLIQMKESAELMRRGSWDIRIQTNTDDELNDLASSLNHLAAQLQIQEGLRSTLSEDIAHELRTPLTTLKSHMQAFQDGIWEPTPKRIYSCYEEVERLIKLVADLEKLNEMDSPEFSLNLKKEKLNEVIVKSMEVMGAAFVEKQVNLKFKAAEQIVVNVDRDRMLQVMINVLSNALHYTPTGGSVCIEVFREKENVRIQVQDSGIGISEQDLLHIFERFYRGDRSRNRKTGGSGIGLAICRKLVVAHNGEIWATSKQGAEIYIRLPVSS